MAEKINDGLTPQQRYDKKNIKRITFSFNIKTEMELLEHLENQSNKQGYIKQLIKNDMKK